MKNTLPTSTYNIQKMSFTELSLSQFYQVAKLRQDVFIIEQQSIYPDLDDKDGEAIHFLCWASVQTDVKLMAYARYRFCDLINQVKIERVVLAVEARSKGLGKQLMQEILTDIQTAL